MRAVVFEASGRVAVAEVPDARIEEPGDALIRVTRAGVCGSDLHFFHRKAPMDAGEGLGHEAVGIVEEVGDGVRDVSPGTRVVVSFQIACGACWFCVHGETALCEDFRNLGAGLLGGALGGAQAELLRVPNANMNLLPIPDAVDDDRALFVGDVLTTGYYAARLAEAAGDETLAIVGAGPVGLCAVQAARLLGAGQVLALDRDEARLALAASWGADPIHVDERSAEMAVSSRTGDRGADAVIEAVGTPDSFESALQVARRGGRVVVAGMYTTEQIEMQLGVMWARALALRFTGVCPVQTWWREVMTEVEAGRLDPEPLISHRLPLAEAQRGYELFDRREATKVVLVP